MKFFNNNLKSKAALFGVAAMTLATSARAEIDTAGITAKITEAGAAAAGVGAAVIIVFVGIKAFKMIRQAL